MTLSFRTFRAIATIACGLTLGSLSLSPARAAEEKVDRGEQILANLRHAFSGLATRSVVMGPIQPSAYGGLDKGSFTVDGKQVQNFLVSTDNTALYLTGDPIDVSRSAAELAAATAKEAAESASELAAATAGRPFRGGAEAAVTIVEFSDFQCPFCSRGAQTAHDILAKYGNDVKFVFADFPLPFHPWAKPAAIAARCAAAQSPDAFWKLHDAYFGDQQAINPSNVMAKTKEYLAGSGLDMAAWSECAENAESKGYKEAVTAIDASIALGQKLGVNGTPGFLVNGTLVSGAQPLEAFVPLIDAAKAAPVAK